MATKSVSPRPVPRLYLATPVVDDPVAVNDRDSVAVTVEPDGSVRL